MNVNSLIAAIQPEFTNQNIPIFFVKMFKECIHTSEIKHVIFFFRYIYPCTLQAVRTPAALSLPAPSNSIHFVFLFLN